MKPKAELRIEARSRRALLAGATPDFARRIAAHADALAIPAASVVAAYIAMGDEADPKLLVEALAARGCRIAYPRVAQKRTALVFHHPQPGGEWIRSAFGVREPSPDWPLAYPKILLVPLLAFDASGHRLGYGGGFYDRTLSLLARDEMGWGAASRRGPLRAIGVAYAGQEVPALPCTAYDHPLSEIVTENGVRRFHHT